MSSSSSSSVPGNIYRNPDFSSSAAPISGDTIRGSPSLHTPSSYYFSTKTVFFPFVKREDYLSSQVALELLQSKKLESGEIDRENPAQNIYGLITCFVRLAMYARFDEASKIYNLLPSNWKTIFIESLQVELEIRTRDDFKNGLKEGLLLLFLYHVPVCEIRIPLLYCLTKYLPTVHRNAEAIAVRQIFEGEVESSRRDSSLSVSRPSTPIDQGGRSNFSSNNFSSIASSTPIQQIGKPPLPSRQPIRGPLNITVSPFSSPRSRITSHELSPKISPNCFSLGQQAVSMTTTSSLESPNSIDTSITMPSTQGRGETSQESTNTQAKMSLPRVQENQEIRIANSHANPNREQAPLQVLPLPSERGSNLNLPQPIYPVPPPSRIACGKNLVSMLWKLSIYRVLSFLTLGVIPLITYILGVIFRLDHKVSIVFT